jgi:adenylate cyclase class 2
VIEVEMKARVGDPDQLLAALRDRAAGEPSTYRDTYFDFPDRRLDNHCRQQVRLRVIETGRGHRCVWTFKGAMLDPSATPEVETEVARADAAEAILTALGLRPTISYTKECENFAFDAYGRRIVATVVRVPELAGTFVEIEVLVPDPAEAGAARDAIHRVIADLRLRESDLEPAFYVDLVAASRQGRR